MSVKVEAVACLEDNYLWLLKDGPTGAVAICDPGEAGPAIAAVEAAGGKLDLILLTHHHGDHINGVAELHARFPEARIVGGKPDAHRLPKLDLAVDEGDVVKFGAAEAKVMHLPGHTTGHIAFHFAADHILLCGDVVFALGCGRPLEEGGMEALYKSFRRLAKLPPETRFCCGHEYTEANARFALSIDSENKALRAEAEAAGALRAAGRPTVPTTLAQELAANPYFRARDLAEFTARREAKNHFRG
ncbi:MULTISPECIES: hydroxyacylglutathione hydrolase [Roseomonadaceae]|uniref:Hydroxyacylglutathione hydrolase n=1 Tax=Falsiroseomonas oleicola TaxID=2801474 RepID=A0ABS6HEX5_9PROT|nr:hydroxyacylglutathione hydrolase [Roseomonas oleicola]MBU8546233.1 hydroxyacylglutathione hydrolase [Roseomonas oleicola]